MSSHAKSEVIVSASPDCSCDVIDLRIDVAQLATGDLTLNFVPVPALNSVLPADTTGLLPTRRLPIGTRVPEEVPTTGQPEPGDIKLAK
jgi:hypothetical protein